MLEEARQNFLALWTRPSPARNITLSQFDLVKVLGRGTYGKVFYASYKPTGGVVALKVQSKRSVIKKDCVTSVIAEKHILACIKFEFIVQLLFHFKDNVNLYLALEFLSGGDFFHFLKSRERLTEDDARFYASNVILALEFLHSVDILFRDLKPENILIDSTGYLKLADFGLAKRCSGKTYSLCGTPEYLAPEIVSLRPYGKSIDIWAFGIFIYEMLFAKTPFTASDYRQMCHKICKDVVNLDVIALTLSGKSLIEALLAKRPSRRIGVKKGITGDHLSLR